MCTVTVSLCYYYVCWNSAICATFGAFSRAHGAQLGAGEKRHLLTESGRKTRLYATHALEVIVVPSLGPRVGLVLSMGPRVGLVLSMGPRVGHY